ncbi:MAG: heavy metal translocating P-type ATPase [Bdellovibrio sp.]
MHDTGWTEQARNLAILPEYLNYDGAALSTSFNQSQVSNHAVYEFFVEGLQCSSCVHLLESMPEYFPEILAARLNFASSHLLLSTRNDLSLAQVLTWIRRMGYEAHPLRSRKDLTERQTQDDRNQLKRLGVAGAVAGNIMLLTIGIYAGASAELARIFHTISGLLFLPALFYAAVPIYKSAWTGIKARSFNVDVPLAIAFWAGSIASYANLIRSEGSIYFDSSAGFLFLILISRWFLKKSQRQWLESPLLELPWTKRFSELRAGERIALHPGQWIPVDAVLLDEAGLFDTSWVTGESLPRQILGGSLLFAGYRNLSAEISIEARSGVADSSLAKQQQEAERQALTKSPKLNQFDVVSQRLLAAVCLTAIALVLTGPTFFKLSYPQAFERALSLLIVACPCALAFGGPLAYAAAIRKCARHGILVKDAATLDRLVKCKSLVFDKTGTLTEGHLQLVSQVPSVLPLWIQQVILGLEKNSVHPVAQAFRSSMAGVSEYAAQLRDVHEHIGEKVFGIFEGRLYSLKKSQGASTEGIKVVLEQDMIALAEFTFEDRIRTEAPRTLRALASQFKIFVSSGDHQERVQNLLKKLELTGVAGKGDRSPSDKVADVQAHSPCIMIGDGVNDSSAMAAAEVGVCMKGAIERGLKTASVYLMEPGLEPLLKLVQIGKQTQKLVRRNLSFALAYNVGAGAAALLGFVTPLTAAILMPISSVLILLSTWESSR